MWFTASILYRSKRAKNGSDQLWEESFVLIRASDSDDALEKAKAIGKDGLVEFATVDNDRVRWEFHDVMHIYEVNEDRLEHGTEVFSRFIRESEARSLMIPFAD